MSIGKGVQRAIARLEWSHTRRRMTRTTRETAVNNHGRLAGNAGFSCVVSARNAHIYFIYSCLRSIAVLLEVSRVQDRPFSSYTLFRGRLSRFPYAHNLLLSAVVGPLGRTVMNNLIVKQKNYQFLSSPTRHSYLWPGHHVILLVSLDSYVLQFSGNTRES